MALSDIKPDPTRAHTFEVKQLVDKEKTFKSSAGERKKYIIEFANGYVAEYCPLISFGIDPRIREGEPLTFRIAYRKAFGDEIEPTTAPTETVDKSAAPGPIVNANGNPATIALLASKDIYGVRVQQDAEYGISDMLDDADIIRKWLIRTINNSED